MCAAKVKIIALNIMDLSNEMAKRGISGSSPSNISRMFSGSVEPSLVQAKEMANILGLSLYEFFNFINDCRKSKRLRKSNRQREANDE